MRRLMAMVIVILLLTPPLLSEASAADKPPQSLFMIDMTIRVSPVNVENASTWMGLFQIHAVLKDPPGQRAYFQYLAANNSTKAREEFGDFVKQLIYDNMRDNIKRRFNAANVSGTIYLPPPGPPRRGPQQLVRGCDLLPHELPHQRRGTFSGVR